MYSFTNYLIHSTWIAVSTNEHFFVGFTTTTKRKKEKKNAVHLVSAFIESWSQFFKMEGGNSSYYTLVHLKKKRYRHYIQWLGIL